MIGNEEDISKEEFLIDNGDGSVSIDPYYGKTREELKTRCIELCRAISDLQFAAMFAATDNGNDIENVREPYRSEIKKLIDAYKD